jgi:aminoglycoside phosphotransferase (APT) family kinase protein
LRQFAGDWREWAGPDEQPLQERLRQISPTVAALLHFDYHPLNLLVEGQTITAVIDWANARPGDPRADFARTYTILKVAPWSPNKPSLLLRLIRWLLEKSWRSGYRQAAGLAIDSAEEMAPFYAWAGAVMLRDLAPRVDKPGFWFRQHHLAVIQHWTESWKLRAGISK